MKKRIFDFCTIFFKLKSIWCCNCQIIEIQFHFNLKLFPLFYELPVRPDLPYILLTFKKCFFSGERTNVPNVKSPSLVQFTHLMAKISVKNIIWAKVKVVRNVGKKSLDIWFELTPLPFIQVSWSKFQVSTKAKLFWEAMLFVIIFTYLR